MAAAEGSSMLVLDHIQRISDTLGLDPVESESESPRGKGLSRSHLEILQVTEQSV